MNLDYDIKERVSNLERMGRKICSDLRNLQKERIILSREAKCLLRKFEKEEIQQNRNKTMKSESKPCSCAVWENDLRKDDENDVGGSTISSTMPDEEFCICTNFCNECCQHCFPGHDRNIVGKYSTSRCNICDESFYTDHLIEKHIDNFYIGDEDTTENDINDDNNSNGAEYLIRSIKIDTRESIERERGGGGKSDFESTTIENLSNQSICTCGCDLCALRNKTGDRPPCYNKREDIYSFSDIDQKDDLLLNINTCMELPEISQYCRIEKLREALEKLKNRNHALRKLLKNQKCIVMNSTSQGTNCTFSASRFKHYDINNNENIIQKHEDKYMDITSDLVAMLKILQNKCRIKDGMIVVLAGELKGSAESERIQKILQKLTDPDLDRRIIDFDRSTLLKYLISDKEIKYSYANEKNYIVHEKEPRSEFTMGLLILILIFLSNNKIQLWRIRCVAMLFLRTTNNICCRLYELIQNLLCNNIVVFVVKCCIHFWNIFLPLIDCCTFKISLINFAYDLVLLINNYFPWSIVILICEIIIILFVWYLMRIHRIHNIVSIFLR